MSVFLHFILPFTELSAIPSVFYKHFTNITQLFYNYIFRYNHDFRSPEKVTFFTHLLPLFFIILKEDFPIMNCYQDNNNIADTSGNLRKNMSDKELQQKLTIETNPQTQLRILIELNTRQARQITALTNRIAILEDKALKKAGRKRVPIYLDGRELTDDDILYYIDEDYYTIVELERVTKAPKNLIRNRYNRAKKKQRIAKE